VTISQAHGLKLCLDCISTFSALELDLCQVYLVTATSGKALGAVAGIAMVLYNNSLMSAPKRLQSFLALGTYHTARGIPFAINSNLVDALTTALDRFDEHRCNRLAHDGATVRRSLRKAGMKVLAPKAAASPAVTLWCHPIFHPSVSAIN